MAGEGDIPVPGEEAVLWNSAVHGHGSVERDELDMGTTSTAGEGDIPVLRNLPFVACDLWDTTSSTFEMGGHGMARANIHHAWSCCTGGMELRRIRDE